MIQLTMKFRQNIIISISSALLFSILYLAGALTSLENRLYDFFLRFRASRERIGNVAFLDIDNQAVALYGVYPWPRVIPANGLLRLKEYGAEAVIFDVEYIDRGPDGIDNHYLERGLANDFHESFAVITRALQNTNNISYVNQVLAREQLELYHRIRSIVLDNDLYFSRAIALNGNTWTTLNLSSNPLIEEEATRRPEIAEVLFTYPVNASEDAHTGAGAVDVLTALPMLAQASKGAGYTNVEVDSDGIRRRIFLTQKINDHWYLQLSFAPLINYLGNPEIELTKNRLTVKQARMPDGRVKDIRIPLDSKGRMMLDWPEEIFEQSYKHVSFSQFYFLDTYESNLEKYIIGLSESDLSLFSNFDPSLSGVLEITNDITVLFNEMYAAKEEALHNTQDESFANYLFYRNQAFSFIRDLVLLEIDAKVTEIALQLMESNHENIDYILEEAEYIVSLIKEIAFLYEDYLFINEQNRQIFNGSFVIIGWSASATTDIGANPFHGEYVNIGTHGVVLDTILSESFIYPLGIWWRIVFMFAFIPLLFIGTAKFHPVKRAIASFSAALAVFIAAILLFRLSGFYWSPLGVLLAMVVAIITREIMEYAGSEKEKQFIRSAFSTYLSGDVVEEIIADPSRMQLGGIKRNMTAIFTDVKAFSTISEKLDPEELVHLLNKYLTAMCDIILEEKGTIDKFEGDAIIAFFGAPIDLPDHALRACVSAIRIKKAEEELNKEIMAHKLAPMPLLTRVGINTGFMVVGNMGTNTKMNYTIMGDAVNLAARLEGVNKQYGTWIMASEDTIKETGNELLYRKLDRVRVVGKSEPVRLCELIDIMSEASDQDKKRVMIFHDALNHFENRAWKQATESFREVLALQPDDELAKMYLERSEQFITHPPQDTWDGVYNLTSK